MPCVRRIALDCLLLIACGDNEYVPPPPIQGPYFYGGELKAEHAQFIPPGNDITKEQDPDAYYRRANALGESIGLWVQTHYIGGLQTRPKTEQEYVTVKFVFCTRCLDLGKQSRNDKETENNSAISKQR